MLRSFKVTLFLGAAVLLTAACSKRGDRSDSAAGAVAPAAVVVAPDSAGAAVAVAAPADVPVELQVAAPPGTGVILTDASGRAVYVLDAPCTTPDCTSQFTPVAGHSMAKAGDTTVKSSMVGSTTGANGAKQATYNGQPLYYYTGDQGSGSTKGQGMKVGSTTAHLVSPSGSTVSGKGGSTRR